MIRSYSGSCNLIYWLGILNWFPAWFSMTHGLRYIFIQIRALVRLPRQNVVNRPSFKYSWSRWASFLLIEKWNLLMEQCTMIKWDSCWVWTLACNAKGSSSSKRLRYYSSANPKKNRAAFLGLNAAWMKFCVRRTWPLSVGHVAVLNWKLQI